MTQKEIKEALIGRRITLVNHETKWHPESRSSFRVKFAYWREEWNEWSIGNLRSGCYLSRKQVRELIAKGETYTYSAVSFILNDRRIRK